MSVRPVCNSYMAGAWMVLLLVHDFRKQMSSTHFARLGIRSETHCPLPPCRANLRVLARTVSRPLVNWLLSWPTDAGSGLPCHFANSGLGSNRSTWLGPPVMNRKMTRFAVGSWCGFLAASGSAARVDCAVSQASARPPRPPPAACSAARRVRVCMKAV